MNKNAVLIELQSILEQLSIGLKYARGYFDGGLFRYKDQSVIYLNRAHSEDKHIETIVKELQKYNLENIEINPEIRGFLEHPDQLVK